MRQMAMTGLILLTVSGSAVFGAAPADNAAPIPPPLPMAPGGEPVPKAFKPGVIPHGMAPAGAAAEGATVPRAFRPEVAPRAGKTPGAPPALGVPRPGPGSAGKFPQPEVKDLGNQRYQVGQIEIDKTKNLFTVPGVVIRQAPPVEFVAVTKGGHKAYESLFELNANAFEFNLACILIGLDARKARAPQFHFDKAATEGDAVDLSITWLQAGKTVLVSAGEILAGPGGQTKDEWVYTGSRFTPDGRYLAQQDGTLIGFVHDPSSIIEHRTGIGLNAFGSIQGRKEALPAMGTPIQLSVRNHSDPSPQRHGH